MDLLKKIGTALASFFVAVVLWLVVHNLDRSSYRFTVPITYDHPANTLKVGDTPATVELQVLATKQKLRTLQASDFEVRVANPQGRTGKELVLLDADDVDAPFGVVVQQVIPSQFTIDYDQRISRNVPVRVAVSGQPAPGYEVVAGGVRSTPAEVRVTGAASRFDADLMVTTEPVVVQGASAPVGPTRVTLIALAPGLSLDTTSEVSAMVNVQARQGRRTLETVPVEVTRGAWQTSAPNPRSLRVTIEGPEPSLLRLEPSAVTLRVDARDREPRPEEDYRLEVTSEVDPVACPECRVTVLSQQWVHVNVRRLPAAALPRPEAAEPAADGAAPLGGSETTTGRVPRAPDAGARRG